MDFPVSFDLFLEMTGLGTGEHGNWIISEEGIRSAINTSGPFRSAHDERLRRMVAQQALLPFPTTATQLRQWENRNDRITPPWFALVVEATAHDAKDILSQEAEQLDVEKREAARQIALAKTSKDLPRHERMANAAMAEQEFNETLLRTSAINTVLTLIVSNDHDKAISTPAPAAFVEKSTTEAARDQPLKNPRSDSGFASRAGKRSGEARRKTSRKAHLEEWLRNARKDNPQLNKASARRNYANQNKCNHEMSTIERYTNLLWEKTNPD